MVSYIWTTYAIPISLNIYIYIINTMFKAYVYSFEANRGGRNNEVRRFYNFVLRGGGKRNHPDTTQGQPVTKTIPSSLSSPTPLISSSPSSPSLPSSRRLYLHCLGPDDDAIFNLPLDEWTRLSNFVKRAQKEEEEDSDSSSGDDSDSGLKVQVRIPPKHFQMLLAYMASTNKDEVPYDFRDPSSSDPTEFYKFVLNAATKLDFDPSFIDDVYALAFPGLLTKKDPDLRKVNIEYVGSGKHIRAVDVTPTTKLSDIIPENHRAFHGHNGNQLNDLSMIKDQDTITVSYIAFQGVLDYSFGYYDYARSISWHSNGYLLASATYKDGITIFDTNTRKCIQTLEGRTNSVAWNTSGTLLASVVYRETKIWDTNTWKCIQTLEGDVIFAVWNYSGTLLAIGSHATIRIWDTNTWTCIQTLEGHTRSVMSVAWNHQGTMLVSGSWDKTIKIWDTATWECIKTLEEHTQPVYSVAWNKGDPMLASGDGNGIIKIWNSNTWKCIQTLEGHTNSVYIVAWNFSGTLLASGSFDATIKIWNTDTWKCTNTLKDCGKKVFLSWNPIKDVLASGSSRGISVWK